ncbi:ADP-ribose pyrophosphatase [Corynebacterium sp. HMSC05C01]|uniref:NUDIX hydrolase n=1 Tax=Corynebacterium coyleae TaxID=53374 RepID=A0AAP7CCN4_9CORY|nr:MULTISPECIES: NUDIX hydrolase [Corynebacterium]MDK8240819.1 NUDIX hydrolase [Corynebacterium coyleae]NJJ04280.1 NUDIX hydrolase [Corynebacterium coyleae]OFT68250.1 ADP-ribose pyrophosphatase [Corynebacterium sp. HMSC05C01]OFU54713.1 ADP-ribose pyrophosphatase [Corynebacterium sp. HMSC11D10]OHO32461.1 ADP-ribose pyrophosphatase [Corynebacterium sp. HMSC034B08]
MSHEFTVESSEVLIDAPIIAVRRDSVVMPGGKPANREIVEHFGAVAVVALDDDGRVALVEQYRHSVGKRLLELPAGLLDMYEEDELVCAKRELVEEAGLEAEQWGVLVDLVTSPGFAEEAVRVFVAKQLREVERPDAEDEEADMDFRWVPLSEAAQMVLRGEIVNSIAVGGILAACRVAEGKAQSRDVSEPFELRPQSLPKRRAERGIVPDMKRI